EVKHHFQDMVFETVIQRNVKLSEAPSYGKPVVLYDASSRGAINHMNLAREILQRNGMTRLAQDLKIINH
ncbi:MAG: ParA family protein, partial [Bacteroidales bacterium]|nr:ParA family protein [Bacteroidales bacterium]